MQLNDTHFVAQPAASPPLTPVTEPHRPERDKFLLSAANRILTRSARNSAVSGTTRSNDELQVLDYSMMETIKYTGPTTSYEWPSVMPVYLHKKATHNNMQTNANQSTTNGTLRKASQVTRVKSAPDMSASIRKATRPTEAADSQQQASFAPPTAGPLEQNNSTIKSTDISSTGVSVPNHSHVRRPLSSAPVTPPPVQPSNQSQKNVVVVRPPPPSAPRPLSLTPNVNLTATGMWATQPPQYDTPQTIMSQQPVTQGPVNTTAGPSTAQLQMQFTDSLPPVKLGHTLVSRNSLPKKPNPPGAPTLRHTPSNNIVLNPMPKSPAKTPNTSCAVPAHVKKGNFAS